MQREQAAHAEVLAFGDEVGVGGGVELVLDLADDLLDHVLQRHDRRASRRTRRRRRPCGCGSSGTAAAAWARASSSGTNSTSRLILSEVDVARADDVDRRAGQAVGDGDRPRRRGSCSSMKRSLPGTSLRWLNRSFMWTRPMTWSMSPSHSGRRVNALFCTVLQHLADRLVEREVIDLGARGHDLADLQVAELEGAGEDLLVALGDRALRDGLGEQAAELLLGVRQARRAASWVDLDAGQAEQAVAGGVEEPDERVEQVREDDQRRGEQGEELVGVVDRPVLRGLLADDDVQRGADGQARWRRRWRWCWPWSAGACEAHA